MDDLDERLSKAAKQFRLYRDKKEEIDNNEGVVPSNTTDYEAYALRAAELAKKKKTTGELQRELEAARKYSKSLLVRTLVVTLVQFSMSC